MTLRPRELAVCFRRLLLVLGVGCYAVGFWYLLGAPPFEMEGASGTPLWITLFLREFGVYPENRELENVINATLILGAVVNTQWLFLCPRGQLAVRLGDEGRPLVRSIIVAALLFTLLSTAMAATLFELLGWWQAENLFAIWAVMGCAWLIWAIIFYFYWQGKDRKTFLSKTLKWLFGGSILELLVAAPVHAMVWKREPHGCYCSTGSYTGLVLGGVVLLWTFGPGLLLLFIYEKQRREPLLSDAGKK